jgi:hypothetical protein
MSYTVWLLVKHTVPTLPIRIKTRKDIAVIESALRLTHQEHELAELLDVLPGQ